MTDPRLGLPSASASERYYHCVGSFLASRGMPENSTADSELGDRGHHSLARWYQGDPEPLGKLPFAESETCLKCIQGVETVLGDLGASLFDGFLQPATGTAKVAMVERRLWLTHEGQRVGSGQADLVVMLLNQPAYVIFDFKLLYGQTSPAESNFQLRSLAALLREALGDDPATIYASIVAPNQSRLPSVVRYDYDASMVALRATVALFRSALSGGPRTPGDHCKWCPALGTCAEAQQHALVPINEVAEDDRAIVVQFQQMAPERLATFLNHAPFAEDVIAAAKAEAARRLNLDSESVPGFRLRLGNWKESIDNPQTVFERFVALGGKSEDFLKTISVTKGKLTDAVRQTTGQKGEALNKEMASLLQGCTVKKQNAPSLEKLVDKTKPL